MEIHAVNMLYDFCIMSGLLFVAKLIRIKVKLFQNLYIPSALLAGVIGLIFGQYGFNLLPFSTEASNYASILIAVLFATLFLGSRKKVGFGKMMKSVGDTFLFNSASEILQFGLFVVIGVTVLPLIFPGIHQGFGLMLPAGFVGGHGTAAAIGSVFSEAGWDEATSVGQTMATIGLILGIVLGVAYINIAVKKGYTRQIKSVGQMTEEFRTGLVPEQDRSSVGENTVNSISIDTLTWHLSLVLISVGGAYLLNMGLKAVLPSVSFPVYGLALIISVLVQSIMKLIKLDRYIDKQVITHIGSSATDYLVAFGVATINIKIVLKYWVPILLLVILGVLLVTLVLFILSKKLFHNYWFERGIYIFGMSTGVMSTGVILLRVVDPEFKTGVLEDFGIAWVFISFIDLALVSLTPVFILQGMGLVAGAVCVVVAVVMFLLCAKIYGTHKDGTTLRADETAP